MKLSRAYKGQSKITKILEQTEDSCRILVQTDVSQMNYINNILNSYENLCFVVPKNPKSGEAYILTTEDFKAHVLEILNNLNIKTKIIT